VLFGLVGAFVGALLGLPLGFFLYDGDAAVVTRFGVGALVGGLFGGTVGAMLGGGMAVKSPEDPLAVECGVPLLVGDAPDGVESVMSAYHPIRIDRFEDGHRVATLAIEPNHRVATTLHDFVANTRDPSRR
jgi:hypothetical protein